MQDYDANLLAQLVQGVLKGIADKSLPVQAAAACALKYVINPRFCLIRSMNCFYCYREFVDSDSTTELLRPLIPQIVAAYFKIMEDLENDVIMSSLQVMSRHYNMTTTIMIMIMTSLLCCCVCCCCGCR